MIRSRNNPQVRTIRRLRKAHARRHTDVLLLEGRHLVDAAAEAGLEFHHLLVTPEFEGTHAEFIQRLEDRSQTTATLIHADRLREQADADAPQGIAALVDPPSRWKSVPAAGSRVLPLSPGLHLYVDGVQDPGNLGAMARSAEAAGAASLLLAAGTARPHQPRALRASAGSLLRLRVWTGVRLDLIPAGASWFALTSQGSRRGTDVATACLFASGAPALELAKLVSAKRVLVAVGNESRGLSTEVLNRADVFLRIATAPTVESLNAAVAASLALFELQRLRGMSHPGSHLTVNAGFLMEPEGQP